MSDVIHNMEHPMVSEIRAQMEVQQVRYEAQLAEKQEKIDDLETDVSDLGHSFGCQYDFVDEWESEIKESKRIAKAEGKPIPKFTVRDLIDGVSSFGDKMYGSCAIDIISEFSTLLDLLDQEEPVTETKTVCAIPRDLKKAISDLNSLSDSYPHL